jgi:hypothetical protein
MKISRDKHDFCEKMDVAYPKLDGENFCFLSPICQIGEAQMKEAAN